MTTTVVTGFHPAGYHQYGANFLRSFERYWPKDVRLVVYAEEEVPLPRGELREVSCCAGLSEFLAQWSGNAETCGRQPNDRWREKDRKRGYNYRYDAVKFCKQLFYPEDAARDLPNGDVLAWFDADVLTLRNIPDNFVEGMLDHNRLVYLGRGDKYSEIGFWAVRLDPVTRDFLYGLAETYRSGAFQLLKEWHSAYVFDEVRRLKFKGAEARSIAAPGSSGHVWFNSPLGDYTDHLKGDRKNLGYSPERKGARR